MYTYKPYAPGEELPYDRVRRMQQERYQNELKDALASGNNLDAAAAMTQLQQKPPIPGAESREDLERSGPSQPYTPSANPTSSGTWPPSELEREMADAREQARMALEGGDQLGAAAAVTKADQARGSPFAGAREFISGTRDDAARRNIGRAAMAGSAIDETGSRKAIGAYRRETGEMSDVNAYNWVKKWIARAAPEPRPDVFARSGITREEAVAEREANADRSRAQTAAQKAEKARTGRPGVALIHTHDGRKIGGIEGGPTIGGGSGVISGPDTADLRTRLAGLSKEEQMKLLQEALAGA